MSEKRIEFMGYEWEEIGGKWLVKIDDLFYEIDWNCSESLVSKLNEQQATIKNLNFVINFQEKEIDSLKTLLKEKEALTEENEQLKKEKEYWKSKFEEGTETFESNLAEDIKHLEEYCGDLEFDVKQFEKENEQLKHTNEKLAMENANLEQSIKFLNNKINTLKETNLTLVKQIRKLPLTDKQFKEMNEEL